MSQHRQAIPHPGCARASSTHHILWGMKPEHRPISDSSPIRSGFGPKVNFRGEKEPTPRQKRGRKINVCRDLHDGGRLVSSSFAGRVNDCNRIPRGVAPAIHDVVRFICRNSTSSREQKLNRGESAIRLRFVPDSFRDLTAGPKRRRPWLSLGLASAYVSNNRRRFGRPKKTGLPEDVVPQT